MHSKRFPAKLLLFGEYTLLNGSRALAVPVNRWGGHLQTDEGTSELVTFAKYILDLNILSDAGAARLRAESAYGLKFCSDIPQGYGVGSSGALCSAMWDRYGSGIMDITHLRRCLARMEDYFHGTSSGLDPLVSYLGSPVLFEGGEYYRTEVPQIDRPRIFLFDTKVPHDTSALVKRYRRWCEDPDFRVNGLRPLRMHVDHAIQFLLDAQWDRFFEHLYALSLLQYTWFGEMIPEQAIPLWERSLSSNQYALKLCGAGGGGYFLGFAREGSESDVGDDVLWIDW